MPTEAVSPTPDPSAGTRGGHRVLEPLGRAVGLLLGHPGQHHEELVAPEAPDAVVGAELLVELDRHLLQDAVAREVAVLVVDRLEVVQVGQQAAERLAAAPGARDLLAHLHVQRPVVEQAR